MDQGLAPNSFRPAAIKAPVVPHAPVMHGRPVPSSQPAASRAAEVAVGGSAELRGVQQPTAEEQRIASLQKLGSRSFSIFNLEMLSMFGITGLVAKGLSKLSLHRAGAGLRVGVDGSMQTLRKTTLGELHQLPANFMREIETVAKTSDGKAAAWATGAAKQADSLSASGEKLAGQAAAFTRPMRDGLAQGVETFGRATRMDGLFNRFTDWRLTSATTKHAATLEKAQNAFTTEGTGFWAAVKHKIMRTKPATVAMPSQLGDTLELMKAGDLKQALTKAEAVAEATAKSMPQVAKQSQSIMKHLSQAMNMEHAVGRFGAASGKGLRGALSAAGKGLGRMPVMGAVIGTGMLAFAGAEILSTRMENRKAVEALDALKQDMGMANHPLIAKAGVMTTKQNRSRWFSTSVSAGANVVGAATFGDMSPILMGSQMLGPMVAQMFVAENALLNAYAGLKAEETGQAQLSPAQKAYFVKQLLVPTANMVEQAAGPDAKPVTERSHLVQAMAQALVMEGKSTKEIVQLAGDTAAFRAYAATVAKQMEAPHAAPAAPVAANDTNPVVNKHLATPAEAQASPSLKLAANDISHQGKVVSAERALA